MKLTILITIIALTFLMGSTLAAITTDLVPRSHLTYSISNGTNVYKMITVGNATILNNLSVTGNVSLLSTLNLNSNKIININELIAPDGSAITFGSKTGVTNTSQAINIYNNQSLAQGTPVFMVESDVVGDSRVHIFVVKERNNSVRLLGNSWAIIPEQWPTQVSSDGFNATNIFNLYNHYEIDPFFSADTSGYGATLFVQGGLDVWRQMRYLEGLIGKGTFDIQLSENDANFANGSVHIFDQVVFKSGFDEGEKRDIYVEIFPGSLGSFVNNPANLINWFPTSNALCDNGECATTFGNVNNSIMTANYTSFDINDTNISFVYSLVNLIGADTLTIELNNNSGSGWVEIFSDAGTDVLVYQSIELDDDFNNATEVTIRATCDASFSTRECYIDTIKINGTVTETTTQNVTGFDGEICFGDGSRDADGFCSRGILYNASADTIFFRGPVNVTAAGGGVSGSGSANSITKWSGASTLTNANIVDDGSLIKNSLLTNLSAGLNVIGLQRNTGNITAALNNTYNIGGPDYWMREIWSAGFVLGGKMITSWDEINLSTTIDNSSIIAVINDGRFINVTPSKTTGNITAVSLKGYKAGNQLCSNEYPGSHMCQMSEILTHINSNRSLSNFTVTFRVSEGAPGFTANANDCGGWRSEIGTALGSIWIGDDTTGGEGSLVACNAERFIGCCG